MKAIFINAADRKVEEIEIENDLHAFYDKIGCRVVQLVSYKDENLVCDEEGRLKDWTAGFQLADWRITGNAILVADDEEGEFTDTKMTAEAIAEKVRFFGREENLGKPHMSIYAF